MKRILQLGLVRALRLYTRHGPWRRGKLALMLLGSRHLSAVASPQVVSTTDGRQLQVDLRSGMADAIYFLGEYERAVTAVVREVVRAGDVCVDVGANLGWYATLFQALTGTKGEVHAFEPAPGAYQLLRCNTELGAVGGAKASTNCVALADEEGASSLHLFTGLPDGHASTSTQGRSDHRSVPVKMTTFDSYAQGNLQRPVDVVKVDAEGSELAFLRGAGALFEQSKPPILVMEMALETSRSMGYIPNDLIVWLRARAPCEFFRIDEVTAQLVQIEGFEPDSLGAYVLCVPPCRRERCRALLD